MNSATKSRWANIFTALVAIFAIGQTLLMTPPFTPHQVYVWGLVLTVLSVAFTKWKQFLSPDVSGTGEKVTIWIAIAATIAGLLDLLPAFSLPVAVSQWIKWGVTVLMVILNILSKQLWASELQKEKMQELKQQ